MSDQQKHILLYPPAKVNLVLKILNRLPNGYHALWSVMQTVGVTDELDIRLNPAVEGIRLECSHASVSSEKDNLVYRAADLVLKQAGHSIGVELRLKKSIPVAAGLGGGSSDAAATIMGLNRLLELGWSTQDMAKLGQSLGSDIPFFFEAPTAVVRGWGEQIVPLQLDESRWLVLVNPGFPIHTGLAYQRLDEARESTPSLADHFVQLEHAGRVAWADLLSVMANDFEPVLLKDFPVLSDVKGTLLNSGAEAALVSGSGATVFGVFRERETAERAKRVLTVESDWNVYVANTERTRLLEMETPVDS